MSCFNNLRAWTLLLTMINVIFYHLVLLLNCCLLQNDFCGWFPTWFCQEILKKVHWSQLYKQFFTHKINLKTLRNEAMMILSVYWDETQLRNYEVIFSGILHFGWLLGHLCAPVWCKSKTEKTLFMACFFSGSSHVAVSLRKPIKRCGPNVPDVKEHQQGDKWAIKTVKRKDGQGRWVALGGECFPGKLEFITEDCRCWHSGNYLDIVQRRGGGEVEFTEPLRELEENRCCFASTSTKPSPQVCVYM